MSKPKEKPFKRKTVKPKKEKKNPLDLLCNEEQRAKLKEIAFRGGVVICTGSTYAPYEDFYKGMRMYMKNPTFNGVALFDTHSIFKKNWMRPIYVLTLNDVGNKNVLHSIRELKGGKLYQRYLYHPENPSAT